MISKEVIKEIKKNYYEKNKEKLRAKYNERNRNSNAKKVAELREQGVTNPWRVIKGYEAKYKKEMKKE